MDLESAARELYGLLPGQFVAARTATARAAAQNGDKELARQVKALPKPPAAAWLVNMLAVHRRDEVDEVIRLGRAISEAQEQLDLEQLRQLGGQRRRLLAAVAEDGRGLAAELGQPVSAAALAEVEQTLHAAMADPDAAAAVVSGLLTGPLSSNGIDPVELEGKVAVPGAAGAPPAPGSRKRQVVHELARRRAGDGGQKAHQEAEAAGRLRRRAQAEVDRAEQRLGDAEKRQRRIRERLDELADRREELEDRIAGLKREITRLEREVSGIAREESAAEEDFEAAARVTALARTTVWQLRQRLEAEP